MDKDLESHVSRTPDWLKPHLEHGFANLATLGLERRERKKLAELFYGLEPTDEETKKFTFVKNWKNGSTGNRLTALIAMKKWAEDTKPTYRDIGDRFKQLRMSRNWTTQQMADELGIKPQRVSDLEYGHRKFAWDFIALICGKFDVSSDWFTDGKGIMSTKTDLTSPRINSLELRMEKAEKLIQHNIGSALMEELANQSHPLTNRAEDGAVTMYGAANASLRLMIEDQKKEIESLKTILEENREAMKDLRDLIRAQRKNIEDLEEVIWERDDKDARQGGLDQKIDALDQRISNLEPDTY